MKYHEEIQLGVKSNSVYDNSVQEYPPHVGAEKNKPFDISKTWNLLQPVHLVHSVQNCGSTCATTGGLGMMQQETAIATVTNVRGSVSSAGRRNSSSFLERRYSSPSTLGLRQNRCSISSPTGSSISTQPRASISIQPRGSISTQPRGSISTQPRGSTSTTQTRGSTSTMGRGSTSTMGRGSTSRPPNDVDLVYIQSITNHQIDKWKTLFDSVDRTGACEMAVEDFQRVLQDPEFYPDLDRHTIEVLQMKCLEPNRQFISYQEFINIMSNKRNPSFRLAVETQGKEQFLLTEPPGPTFFSNMVRKVAKQYLTDDVERQYYADKYTCCPPPLFIPVITIAEVGFFVYHCLEANSLSTTGPVPVHSILIYRPDRRIELWRFILYMFIHAGWVHLFFNMLVQIIVGIPLEMVHGSLRIALVYLAGVLAGSLGTSVFDIQVYLVGASGGVYALLAAHLANVMLNYTNMEFGIIKLAAVLIVASADVGFAVWDRYSNIDAAPPVGYTAHLMGALAGLTMGLVVLKNFEQKLHEQYLWWISLSVYLVCFAFAIFWNIFYY